MSETTLFETNLYDLNKQIMSTKKIMKKDRINHELKNLAAWVNSKEDNYFMLLCHERRDYTIFRLLEKDNKYSKFTKELLETLKNRGDILEIELEKANEVYSIWIKDENESFVYYFFPYDMGVITV